MNNIILNITIKIRPKMGSDSSGLKRKLACQGCRKRRRKCNFEVPCSNCIKFGSECVSVNLDLRKSRYSCTYVKTLENRIAHLESSLKHIAEVDNEEEKNKIIESLVIDDIATPEQADNLNVNSFPVTSVGSSSIYPQNSLSITNKRRLYEQNQLKVILKNLSTNPMILKSLSLFFKWLYPAHYLFIHRETFLSAFFGDAHTKSYYCSEELVYAISALGSKLSDTNDELFTKSKEYYQTAKSIVLKKIFQLEDSSFADSTSSSKLAIIQTLLCLAFFDIGSGENPMAWYLSGLAFRIAHEIGLHLNPEAWNTVYEDELLILDFEVRSRIYWGCYLADHLISVLFGRSTILKLSSSTVPETDELPEIESGIEDFIYEPRVLLSTAAPLKKLIVLSRITEIFASKIFTHADTLNQRSEFLSKFNLEMYNWKINLPPELGWSKSRLKELKVFNPTTSYILFHYHIVLISYNKPFIFEFRQSRSLIEESIEELYYLFNAWKRSFTSFEKCNLYMVYSAILAIQCMNSDLIRKDFKVDFKRFLESSTLNYELAKKFLDNQDNHDELFGALSHGTDFALEYNFDFTLLNEIDTLIGSTNTF
ncbi:hypothetical protein Kpol_1033p15 [Vanderwaltozyma polyspora DSM 70294]|uniref:Zn(2)-C6 fungal-type domain-containing protein n=1 Tax=Vanderwaltozyma polyspora (strain ATCC 22028 / DSM 70294 / BCRC 21397 / CBS 2163 / NBRC 10782 / NRRL Y-8283 / UCD 57-17) TaxID=436907 RepID=A7TJ13_VANPO|nr:uncharacterized protein Kpol_1033p15 [Vanderwaltozyma polyspora DSM 70294]EDO17712.1 hypothetical protein Kpol_1033p15 [Vanderwaltozyma polyspora DSM 70294]